MKYTITLSTEDPATANHVLDALQQATTTNRPPLKAAEQASFMHSLMQCKVSAVTGYLWSVNEIVNTSSKS